MKIENPNIDELSDTWGTESNDSRDDAASGHDGDLLPIADTPSIFSLDEESITWAVDGFIAIGAVTLISADSGLLKSTLLTACGRAGADGHDFAGLATTKRQWLILDRGENSIGTVQERYRRLRFEDGNGLYHRGAWLGDVPTPASALTVEYVTATNPRPVIVVDSLISHFEGDENSSVEMRAFMRHNRHLANLGAGVVILHHPGKSETSKQYRGSSDIKASVDVAYEVEGVGDPTRLEGLTLKAFKSRFAARQRLSLRFDGSQFYSDEPAPMKNNTEKLRDLLIAHPGIKATQFCSLAVVHKLGRDRARVFLTGGRQNETIECSGGSKNAQFHTWVGSQNGQFD